MAQKLAWHSKYLEIVQRKVAVVIRVEAQVEAQVETQVEAQAAIRVEVQPILLHRKKIL